VFSFAKKTQKLGVVLGGVFSTGLGNNNVPPK